MEFGEAAETVARILGETLHEQGVDWSLAFSGGLDSTVLMFASGLTLKPWTAGTEGSRDIRNAEQAASILGFGINRIKLDREAIERYRDIIIQLDPGITRQEIGYEVVLASVLDHTGNDTLVTGQGADEIFYGYRRFIDDPSLDNSGHLAKLFDITLPRERKMAGYFGRELVTPYLSPAIISAAGKFRRDDHIAEGVNKRMLRASARILGVPDELVSRPKKAAQYGSGVSRILSRL